MEGLEDGVGIHEGVRDRVTDLVEGLPQRTGRGRGRIGPQVGRDRLAGTRSTGHRQQGEERLRMPSGQADLEAVAGPGAEPTEQTHVDSGPIPSGTMCHDGSPAIAVGCRGVRPIPPGSRTPGLRPTSPQTRRNSAPLLPVEHPLRNQPDDPHAVA